jgi:SET domain-containing protein
MMVLPPPPYLDNPNDHPDKEEKQNKNNREEKQKNREEKQKNREEKENNREDKDNNQQDRYNNTKYRENYYLAPSKIHGTGTHATKTLHQGEKIGVGIEFDTYLGIMPYVTPNFGRWINHSWTPNAKLDYDYKNQKWNIIASKRISKDNEITINYQDTPWYILKPNQSWKK